MGKGNEQKEACHLPVRKTVPATVDRIEFQTVHPSPGQEEIKLVMHFVGKQKGLILTSTNQDFLRDHFGDDIAASYGKTITLRGRKTVAGRGVDTILIGLPAHIILEGEVETPASKTNQIQTSIPRLIRMGDVLILQINRV